MTIFTTLPDGQVVRARAPLRLGLAGGGTDLSPYCDSFGGAVLNCTIDRHAYCFIEASPDGLVHFIARDIAVAEAMTPDPTSVQGAALRLQAGVYLRMMRDHAGGRMLPLRITTAVDAPPGSGLGSSSALCVAMVEAFRELLGLPLGLYDVAHLAFEIERLDLGLAGGKQDQYAAAFGGANFIEFLAHDRVIVNPLRVSRAILCEFETSLVTCFTGVSRRSDRIITEQQAGITEARPLALESLHQLKAEAIEMKQALLRGEIRRMAETLNRSWDAKKRTARGVSTDRIDHLYDTALGFGAIAGKVSGAGGGGFMMFMVPPQTRTELIAALNRDGANASAVRFTAQGAESWRAAAV